MTVYYGGLLFGSGWYIDADEFTRQFVSVAVETFRTGWLEATVEYFAWPYSALAGLETAVNYYNTTDAVEGEWFPFIADESGRIAAHSQPLLISKDLREAFGEQVLDANADGKWVTTEPLRCG